MRGRVDPPKSDLHTVGCSQPKARFSRQSQLTRRETRDFYVKQKKRDKNRRKCWTRPTGHSYDSGEVEPWLVI